MRAVADRPIVVRVSAEDETGALIAQGTGLPTVSVVDGAGTAVTGVTVASDSPAGTYKVTIPARSQLDRLTITTDVTPSGGSVYRTRAYVDVVSERLVPLSRLKEDAEMASLSATVLARIADGVEDWFRSALQFPAVQEGARVKWGLSIAKRKLTVPGVYYPWEFYSLSLNGDAIALADFEIVDGGLVRETNASFLTGVAPTDGFYPGTYLAHVRHGADFGEGMESPPEDLRRAAAVLARYVSRTSSNFPERATRVVTQETEIVFAFPSPERPTGLPEVDTAITRYRAQAVV